MKYRMSTMIKSLILVLILALPAHPRELHVDDSTTIDGDGSVSAPLKTISQAVKQAEPQDTIVVHGGIYHESISLGSGLTLRAAAEQRVVISGFSPISGWKPYRAQIYSTTVKWPAVDLFVGSRAQPLATYPSIGSGWSQITSIDSDKRQVTDTALAGAPMLDKLSKPKPTGYVFVHQKRGNYFRRYPIRAANSQTGTLTLAATPKLTAQAKDRYLMCGSQAFINGPGQWAYERLDNVTTRLYFWPERPADLERTQSRRASRPLVQIGHWKTLQSAIRFEGIEVTGSRTNGIQIRNAEDVTIERCIIHDNAQSGLSARPASQLIIRHCIAYGNKTGIVVASSNNVIVEENEVANNWVDGIVIAGDVSGRGLIHTTRNVVVRGNYVHHHLFLSHPDNCQTYRGVSNLRLERNLFLWAGQGLMTEQTSQSELIGNVMLGTAAVTVIFGHGSSNQWTLTNNTIGFGGWGALNMSGHDYQLHRNILLANTLSCGKGYQGDYNLVWPGRDDWPFAITSPPWKSHDSVAEFTDKTGQDKHSRKAPPKLKNVPMSQAMLADVVRSTADRLYIRSNDRKHVTAGFSAGDHIEINGDGIVRRITQVDENSIAFQPALPRRPFRQAVIWNWGDRTDFQLDIRPSNDSPVQQMKDGQTTVGSDLNAQAMMRGDFNGDGIRDLPTLPKDLQQAWPDPNNPPIPYIALP